MFKTTYVKSTGYPPYIIIPTRQTKSRADLLWVTHKIVKLIRKRDKLYIKLKMPCSHKSHYTEKFKHLKSPIQNRLEMHTVIPKISFLTPRIEIYCDFTHAISWTSSTHEAYYKCDISQRLKPQSWTAIGTTRPIWQSCLGCIRWKDIANPKRLRWSSYGNLQKPFGDYEPIWTSWTTRNRNYSANSA